MEYKTRLKYPHLGPEDAAIWQRFIEANPNAYQNVEYDVRVGEGRDYSALPEDVYSEDLKGLSKKRIDVVGNTGRETHIIELKPSAGLSAIGQVFGLAELYRAECFDGRKIKAVLITDQIIPDMEFLCLRMNVQIISV